MAPQPNPPHRPSRRAVVAAGSTLLAGFGLDAVLPGTSLAAGRAPGQGAAAAADDLALYRPVRVSSTDYAPTPGQFAVDQLSVPGVRGSGWRAGYGDPQWISVDLQAVCRITRVKLTFEADGADPVFTPPTSGNPRLGTTGQEILSSYATDFAVEVSGDGTNWTSVYRTGAGSGGVVDIPLAQPVTGRWVRMTARKRSSPLPLGVNGFAVYGTVGQQRPPATGWTDWGTRQHRTPALRAAADGTVPLETGWVLTMDDWAQGQGAQLSKPGVDTSAWLPATVPGTVLGSLVEQGRLPDPVSGLNNLRIPEALSRHSWWYKRDFDLPRGLRTGPARRVWLEFDGINHAAEIWLNGERLGELAHPFARSAHDVTRLLTAGERNALAVRITPIPVPGSPGDKGSAGEAWVDAGANSMNLNSPTYLAASGWDWMPAVRDRVAGIWNHVRLRSTGAAVIGDPRVDTALPQLPDTSLAELTVTVPVRNADAVAHDVTVSAAFEGVRVSRTVTVAAGGSSEVVFTPDAYAGLRLRSPRLWWPNGLGDPHLYDLTLTAAVEGEESDRRVTRFGVRQFGYEYAIPLPFGAATDACTQRVDLGRQQARFVRVRCLTRATEWGSSLWALSVFDSGRAGIDLALHADADASSADGDDRAAGNATDGDLATRWSSAYADDQWISVDLGSVQSFDRVDVVWERAYARTYVVQVSQDGAGWTDVKAVDNTAVPLPFGNGDGSLRSTDFTARTARHVRIACGVRNTSWGNSLWSLSLLDSADPATDWARGATVTASTQESDHPATHAVDGDPTTRWASQAEDHQWIQVDLGAPRRLDRVSILWERAYPKTYTVQTSDDALTWSDVTTVSNEPEPLKISVNGLRVMARGGNWGWDELLRRMPAERMDAAVRMHRDMNFTMIRNWLGSSDREEFFAACDEHGILVWNDFPTAWAMDAPDRALFVAQARDTVLRYRIHPCVVIWCGANEGDPPPVIDQGMRKAVEEQAPGLLYQSNSAGGIATGGGPYGYVEPEKYFDPQTYGSKSFGFHTEIGMPVVPTAESLRHLVEDQPEWPIGPAWYYHDWSERGNQAPQQYKAAIEARLGTARDLEDFSRKAQFVNFENGRAMFEAWNSRLWDDATGLMLWMSHPAWHSTVWQTYDYDFDVNGMYYGARGACEPIHVQADPVHWRTLAVNHSGHEVKNATLTARLHDLTGRPLAAARTAPINVGPSSTEPAFTTPWSDALPDLHLLRLALLDSAGRPLSTNTYWRYRTPESMTALNRLEQARLSLTAGHTELTAGRRTLTATIRNRGTVTAAMTRLSLRDARSGDRVLPTLYSDNYLWLLPGEQQTVTASWPDGAHHGPVSLRAEAFNSPRTETTA